MNTYISTLYNNNKSEICTKKIKEVKLIVPNFYIVHKSVKKIIVFTVEIFCDRNQKILCFIYILDL